MSSAVDAYLGFASEASDSFGRDPFGNRPDGKVTPVTPFWYGAKLRDYFATVASELRNQMLQETKPVNQFPAEIDRYLETTQEINISRWSPGNMPTKWADALWYGSVRLAATIDSMAGTVSSFAIASESFIEAAQEAPEVIGTAAGEVVGGAAKAVTTGVAAGVGAAINPQTLLLVGLGVGGLILWKKFLPG